MLKLAQKSLLSLSPKPPWPYATPPKPPSETTHVHNMSTHYERNEERNHTKSLKQANPPLNFIDSNNIAHNRRLEENHGIGPPIMSQTNKTHKTQIRPKQHRQDTNQHHPTSLYTQVPQPISKNTTKHQVYFFTRTNHKSNRYVNKYTENPSVDWLIRWPIPDPAYQLFQ